MILRVFSVLLMVCCSLGISNAQVVANLILEKKQHVAGEPVTAVVTITNHAGRELIFQSDGRFQWLDFLLTDSNGGEIIPRKVPLFGPMKIKAGQTLARQVDLSKYFVLTEAGTYTVKAVVREPSDTQKGFMTNRVFFNQTKGRLEWSQRVGVPGKTGATREYRLLHFSGDSKVQAYAQIFDVQTGRTVNTFPLGDLLMVRKPVVTIDQQQRMNVMFLATPSMWVHSVVDTNGVLVSRSIHQRGAQGDPQMMTTPDGKVKIVNSIPYNPNAEQKERARQHNASERPPSRL